MTRGYAKLRLLLWKNWTMAVRNPGRTVSEILVPVVFSALIILLRIIAKFDRTSDITRYPAFVPVRASVELPEDIRTRFALRADKIGIAWCTEEDSIVEFDNAAAEVMASFEGNFRVVKFDTPSLMEDFLTTPGTTDLLSGERILCGVVFDGKAGQMCTNEVEVTLRFPGDLRTGKRKGPDENWQTKHLFPKQEVLGPRYPVMKRGPLPSYYNEIFLTIQLAICTQIVRYCGRTKDATETGSLTAEELGYLTDAMMEIMAAKSNVLDLKMRRYSFPPYSSDRILNNSRFVVPFLIMLSFIYTCMTIAKYITHEKETQMKELMKIMGLASSLHWIAWFIRIMVILIITVALIVIVFVVPFIPDNAVFGKSDPSALFAFYTVYMVALTCFCFMVSSFFNKGHIASVVAGLLWFMFYVPHFFLVDENGEQTYPLSLKIPLQIFLNVAMAFSIELFLVAEAKGIGIKWSNICLPMIDNDKVTVCHCIMMLLLDAVIYMLICLYVEAVMPGTYGVPEPWYYFFSEHHWRSTRELATVEVLDATILEKEDPSKFEKEPKIFAGVQIKQLRKEFGKNKIAVHNLTLNMYESQITVLLGHNGAGKTTTMSILTGIYTPTRGMAIINGCDIARNIEGARRSLGLCPQHNVLFDELTVHEHFYFFCKLKGMSNIELEPEIGRFVVMLELGPKEHAMSRTLSGGMKRKLNAGIALCAHSKVVLLDEPTSGMDPAARRAIWDMLILEKEGRTIMLSTHFMDEADVLGDRIAIMAAGMLQCCGSPFFLKKRYGGGYRLIIEKGPECDTDEVTDLLDKYVPGVYPSQDIGSELSYQLDEDYAHLFEPMFRDLEASSGALDVKSYGVALTTMEEVFINTGKDKESRGSIRRSVRKSTMAGGTMFTVKVPSEEDLRQTLVTGSKLTRYRIEALILKKHIVYRRGWFVFLLHCLFPIIIICAVLLVGFGALDVQGEQERRRIEIKSYSTRKVTVVAQRSVQNSTERNDVITRAFYKLYKDNVRKSEGDVNDLEYSHDAVTGFDDYMLQEFEEHLKSARTDYPVGASFGSREKVETLGWFNDLPLHSAPLTLSLITNTFLFPFDSMVTMINHPLPVSTETQAVVRALYSKSSRIAPFIAFAFAFVSAYYCQFLIRERVCKNKHLQFVSGVEAVMFWSVHAMWDGLFFIFPCIATIITLAGFRESGYDSANDYGRIMLILLFFGWAMLPMMYCASFMFDIPATGYSRVAMFNIFTGTAAFMVISLFRMLEMAKSNVDIMEYFFFWTPHYVLAHAIHNQYMNHIYNNLCGPYKDKCDETPINPCCPGKCPKGGCLEWRHNYFDMKTPGIGLDLVVLTAIGIFFYLILFLLELHVISRIKTAIQNKKRKKKGIDAKATEDDNDVTAERNKIRETDINILFNEYTLILKDVTKYYGTFLAVNHTCVGVGKGECFGLLGSNGAGKTTTFQMMTGDIRMSEGQVFVDGLNLQENKKSVQRKMGYCPQFDALLDEMTGWEIMKMFCLMRGVPKQNIKSMSEKLADLLLITKHMPKKVKTYSGGNKRKLSTAVALIGNPSVVFLDEPTTGMDPMARRHLWNVICNVRDSGTSVVLTSHSMEECEALCTKIAIQVNGNFRCLGSLQHLKNKFAKGFTLQVKVTPPSSLTPPTTRRDSMALLFSLIGPVKRYIYDNFKGAQLEDEYMGVLTYSVPKANYKWSQMFGLMEKAKKQYAIEDYSIGQTSLEQVFLSFTKEQKSED